MNNKDKRELMLLIFGIICMIIGTYLVVSTVGWALWFGIIFMTITNNVSQRLRNEETFERKEDD